MASFSVLLRASIEEVSMAYGMKFGALYQESGAYDFFVECTGDGLTAVEYACRFLHACRDGNEFADHLVCLSAIHFLDTVLKNRPATVDEQKTRLSGCLDVIPGTTALKQYEIWASSWF
jgi:hypothetical protein